ncbi:hydantoinase B/oxoprolinase family protein [Synechococcus sp. HJ21-Hayes]|uniref:hydantoinase B/oxoprolinase family protein n=1 Tax=unclassified Synechococcus TaxID=2626047 RepID=UPI0020CF6B71|nr:MULTISPECIES: hydantoinase B/oxoprolinase family protein [unclassified Synechococcus]MCP9832120.1 hydantoinase B/oxoprolinase family protein [Synechococcus sp. JJ3a-Johnson]MCP9854002.1 hydantoinase B/oxoprolinase family protein [Synechococcus sp. HJ21-Hayes]
MAGAGWRFWIDRGGTFTDLVARSPRGELVVRKLLSVQPDRPGDPAVRAIRALLGPGERIEEVRLGTTVATNALLERRGAPTLLLLNRGFADLLRIGDQHRPDLFALRIDRPDPLEQRVLEVGGRLAADGRELEPLQLDGALAEQLRQARADGLSSVAVALLHSYRYPSHELQLGAWLATFGFEQICLSHRVSALPRLVPRGQTTVLEAYVGPALRRYLDQVQTALGAEVPLRIMQSSGGLIGPDRLQAKDTMLSGPAGGLVGAARTSAAAGYPVIVGFDMGGTSTDVCYCDGEWERREQWPLAGFTLQAPMLQIHTVAAGGGSVLQFDGQRLQVGPASAGADPGPACYRRGGPLTLTDANLLLGRLQPQHFPAVFGPQADQPLDPQAARRPFAQLAAAMGTTPELVAEGAIAIAIERMAEAIRRISIQQGHDVRQAALCSFGGAGGQHACALAEALDMHQVLLHPLAGVLSAYGIGLADERQIHERVIRQPLTPALLEALEAQFAELAAAAGGGEAGAVAERRLQLRTPGSDTVLPLAWGSYGELLDGFQQSYRRRYGYLPTRADGQPLQPVVERLTLELIRPGASLPDLGSAPDASPGLAAPPERVQLFVNGAWRSVPLLQRSKLRPGQRLEGPALIVEATGTNLLLPGWGAELLPGGSLLLSRSPGVVPAAQATKAADAADPVLLELFNHRFAAIAEQMGTRLQLTSASVNIKERLDFSCALFDCRGALVANAPHIPVHLGSMGASVVALLAAVERGEHPPLAPGDAVVSNNPFNGGTHLPDLTVITPVFAGPELIGFVASRGHHADVGGTTPGSMPPHSRSIAEEGLLLDNVPLIRDGAFEEAVWRQRLAAGPWPVRNPDQLLADLQAQVAANRLGVERLQALIAREGLQPVQAYMAHGQAHAAEAVRRVIDRLQDGSACVRCDGGLAVAVAIRVNHDQRSVCIDFTGTSPQQPSNLNAPLAITRAAVLYVFRCLVQESIPLNAGCFEPLELVVPAGCLLNPRAPAAVVAGNVETSQVVVNALFAALGVMAAAQGTMNNLIFGNHRCQYYETICGGSGAGRLADGRGFPGASGVQTHMTNSRLTDPEILEERLPVRLELFAVRHGSGGGGRWPGGDGVVRQLRFLEPVTLSLLTGARQVAPFGLAGGAAAACGQNQLLHGDGRVDSLAGVAECQLQPGDAVRVCTPGGGGYGVAEEVI